MQLLNTTIKPDAGFANAHLIASAPDMYELLQDILTNYQCGDIIDRQIEEVLAKARGE